jgi:Kef-type K+ transport system membrane component KefB
MSLLYLGALILLGFLCARLFKRVGLPGVTGYLTVGVLLGPSMFHMVGEPELAMLKPVAAFGIATIFFLLGEEFNVKELCHAGGRLLVLTVTQSLVTFAVTTAVMLLVHVPLVLAVLFGAIAGTSDPAAALVVIRELRGRGELVRTLMAVMALNGFVEMLIFSSLMPVVDIFKRGPAAMTVAAVLNGPVYEFCGSLLVGLALALILRGWSLTPGGREALKVPTIGLILLGTGVCEAVHLSPLLVMLTFGALVANTVPVKIQIFDVAKAMEGPLLIMFFTLSGACLHLAELIALGGVGLAYIVGRIGGKMSGGWLGARLVGTGDNCRRYLGFGLIPQAGMAIGLAYIVQQKFPDITGPVLPVILGAVVVFEAVGPILTRWAIIRSGESMPLPPVPLASRAKVFTGVH